MGIKTKIIILLLLLLLTISFLARVIPLEYAHYWDETVYLNHAETMYNGTSNYSEISSRPPFLSVLIAGTYFIKYHIFSADVLVAILGVLGVLFIYLIGKKLYNQYIGLLAATFLGLSPFIILQNHFILTDMPSLTFLIIATYFFIFNKNKIYQFISGLFFAIAILTRFTSLIVVIIFFIYLLIKNKKQLLNLLEYRYLVFGAIVALLPYFIWAQINCGFFLAPFILANKGILHSMEPLWYYLANTFVFFPIIVVFGLSLFLINYRNIKNIDWLFIFWALLFLLYISITPHKETRYLIPLAFPVCLLSAKGIIDLITKFNKNFKIILFVLLILALIFSFIGSFGFISKPIINYSNSEEMGVAFKIKEFNTPNYIIYSNFNYPVFAYYTRQETIRLDSFDNISFYEKYPKNMTKTGYLIIYKNINIEPSIDWIESKLEFTKVLESTNIIVYKYTPT